MSYDIFNSKSGAGPVLALDPLTRELYAASPGESFSLVSAGVDASAIVASANAYTDSALVNSVTDYAQTDSSASNYIRNKPVFAPVASSGSYNDLTDTPSFASSGENSNITSLTGLTTPLSAAQGGTGLSALGTAGQVLTVNSGATGLEFATISTTPTWDSITGKPTVLAQYNGTVDDSGVITLENSVAVADIALGSVIKFTAANTAQGVAVGDLYQKKLINITLDEDTTKIVISGAGTSKVNGTYTLTSGAGYDRIWSVGRDSLIIRYWPDISKWIIYDGVAGYYATTDLPVDPWNASGWYIYTNGDLPLPSSWSTFGNTMTNSILQFTPVGKDATTSSSGLMSASDKENFDLNIPSALGTAGQVLTINSGATATEWATPASGINLSAYGSSYNGNYARFFYSSGGIDADVTHHFHFNDSNADEVGTETFEWTNSVSTYGTGKFSNAITVAVGSRLGWYLDTTKDVFSISTPMTWDFWIKPTSVVSDGNSYDNLISQFQDSYWSWLWFHLDSDYKLIVHYLYRNGAYEAHTTAVQLTQNEWQHVAIVHDGSGVVKVYVNGQLKTSYTFTYLEMKDNSGGYGDGEYFVLGGRKLGDMFGGCIDEYRISKGVARWTADFTPPAAPYSTETTRALYIDTTMPPYISAPSSPAQGDILYYSGSAWAKLAAGTSGQYLQTQGASANPQWATVTSGMTNPMTTAGDLIIGGTSGAPARLAAGTDGYVLTLSSGAPTWAASASGLLKASGSGYALDNGSTGRGTIGIKSVSLEYSSAGSGYGAIGNYSISAGGIENVASGFESSVFGGLENTASGNYSSVFGGVQNTSIGEYSVSGGYRAKTSSFSEFSFASGRFSANGDCQRGSVQARIATSSTDAAVLYLDGSSAKFTLSSGDHYSCRVHLIGAQADGSTGDYYAIVKIKNISGTTSLSGTVRVLEAWEGDTNLGTPTIAITADDTNDCLQVAVTPANATATRWSATIEYIKINY